MNKIKNCTAWLFLAISYFILFMFIYKHGIYMLDSDMSSELVLAKQLAEENALISSDWWYSTELRVINTQLVFMPLFKTFHDWELIRAVGSAVLLAIYLFSYYVLIASLGCGKCFAVSAGFLIMPCSMVYVVYVLFGVYYIPHICFSFVLLGLILFCDAVAGKKKIFLALLLCIISFAAGLGGLRQILIFSIPVILASIAMIAKPMLKNNKPDAHTVSFVVCSLLSFVFTVLGYLVNANILANIFSFTSFGGINFVFPDAGRMELVLHEWIRDFGYTEGDIFSGRLVYNTGCLCLIILIPVSVRDILKKDKYSHAQRLLALYFVFAALVYSAFIICSDFEHSGRYSLPIAVFALPVITIWFSSLDFGKMTVKVMCAMFISLMLVCSLGKYRNMLQNDNTAELRHINEMLCSEGYTEGYATFWNGNIMTELSNGEIEMWVLNHSLNGLDDIYHWLQDKEHGIYQPESPYFLLIDNSELDRSDFIRNLDAKNRIYTGDHYIVYTFNELQD